MHECVKIHINNTQGDSDSISADENQHTDLFSTMAIINFELSG